MHTACSILPLFPALTVALNKVTFAAGITPTGIASNALENCENSTTTISKIV